MPFKGIFSPDILQDLFGYNCSNYFNGTLEHDGGVSYLKAGINYSDQIVTVSESYAEESIL